MANNAILSMCASTRLKCFFAVLFTLVLVVGLAPAAPLALAADADADGTFYYVSPDGSDSNSGTEESPFASISKAASVMVAGDTCRIKAGVYRETISDASRALAGTQDKPIMFEKDPASEGDVVLSGCDEVQVWAPYAGSTAKGNVWQASAQDNPALATNIYEYSNGQDAGQGNLVFADGRACVEARWPNLDLETVVPGAPSGTKGAGDISQLMDRSTYARVGDGTASGAIVDELLFSDAEGGIAVGTDLVGAQVWCVSGYAYWSYLSKIIEQDKTAHKIQTDTAVYHGASNMPRVGQVPNIYYICRSLALLDVPYEWYKDTESNTLYVCLPQGVDPTASTAPAIEARAREYAVDLRQSSHVTFSGIDVRGALVSFDGTTSDCTFANATLESLDTRQAPNATNSSQDARGHGRGVFVAGAHNTVSNCEIKNMFAEAVTVSGTENAVVNNYIHDVCFEVGFRANAIHVNGKRHLIAHNTVTSIGHSSVGDTFDTCEICYNDFSNANLLTLDSGVLYFNAHDYKGSVVHHNVLRDSTDNEGFQAGLYLDSFTTGFVFHHNLVYGIENPASPSDERTTLFINPHSRQNIFVNNTFANLRPTTNYHCDSDPLADFSGSVFANNLFYNQIFQSNDSHMTDHGITFTGNLTGTYININGSERHKFADGTSIETGKTLDESGRVPLWVNSADGNYALAEGSPAIDRGVAVAGITDDCVDSKPDSGCYEYGAERWQAGCDLSRDVTASFSLDGAALPGTNGLQNPDLETLEGWSTAGSPQRMVGYSWGNWGAVAKGGDYLVKLADGDALEQTVSGLKPNTTYELSGYGRVAGTFVAGVDVWNTKAIDASRRLEYDNVDFGSAGIDSMLAGFHGLGLNDVGVKVEVLLDDASNPVGAFTFEEAIARRDIPWEWFDIRLDEPVTGTHRVTFRLVDGPGSATFDGASFCGFFLNKSSATDSVTLSARSDSGDQVSIDFTGRRFPVVAPTALVTTGDNGSITVSVTKGAGQLYGYVDELCLAEKIGGPELGRITFADQGLFEAVVTKAAELGINCAPDAQTLSLELRPYDVMRITSLDASDRGISDLTGLGRLSALRELNLSGNTISSLVGIENLVSLRKLDLSKCGTGDLSGLEYLGALQELDIIDDDVADVTPLIGLRNLTVLKAAGNEVSDITKMDEHMRQLVYLDLSRNKLADESPYVGYGYDYSRVISVTNNLRHLYNLKYLDLSENGLRFVHGLYYMYQLEHLDLHGNNIRDLTYFDSDYNFYGESLKKNLKFLDLSDNNRPDTGEPSAFDDTKENTDSGTGTTLATIASMQNLEEFHFTANNAPEIAEYVKQLKNLKTLDLTGNNLTGDDAAAIKTELPGLVSFKYTDEPASDDPQPGDPDNPSGTDNPGGPSDPSNPSSSDAPGNSDSATGAGAPGSQSSAVEGAPAATKAANPLKVKGKKATVKSKQLKRKSVKLKLTKLVKLVKKGKGKMAYKLASAKKGGKNFKKRFKLDAKTGKLTVKKGLSTGAYKLKLKLKAAGNADFSPSAWKIVTVSLRVV